MSLTTSVVSHPKTLLASLIAIAMLSTPEAEAERWRGACAVTDSSGFSSLVVNAGQISAADIQNRSAGAWTKIAQAAEDKYGGNVNVGMVSMVVRVEVQPLGFGPSVTTIVPMTIVFDYSGQHSINQAVRDFANIPREAEDPSPCDPEKNACCADCGWTQYASASQFFKSGFFSHEQFIASRQSNVSRKVVKKFTLMREVEAA